MSRGARKMLTVVDENYGGWDAEILAAFETMEVGTLADFYFSEIDLDPDGESKRIKQVEEVMERRGLTFDDLLAAWPNGGTEDGIEAIVLPIGR